jgi:hypothetical protein
MKLRRGFMGSALGATLMLSLPQVSRGAELPAVGGCEVIAIEGTVGPDRCTYQTNSTIGQTVVVTADGWERTIRDASGLVRGGIDCPYQSLECSSAVQNYHQYPLGSVTLRVLAGVGWARDK